ncbi:hypothetical protein HDU76_001836 [Blyttiomyces sp. JEL0837]|nr:hypothetical protein HDU76_001836 [Blyttiomyces sp. JEL0837]
MTNNDELSPLLDTPIECNNVANSTSSNIIASGSGITSHDHHPTSTSHADIDNDTEHPADIADHDQTLSEKPRDERVATVETATTNPPPPPAPPAPAPPAAPLAVIQPVQEERSRRTTRAPGSTNGVDDVASSNKKQGSVEGKEDSNNSIVGFVQMGRDILEEEERDADGSDVVKKLNEEELMYTLESLEVVCFVALITVWAMLKGFMNFGKYPAMIVASEIIGLIDPVTGDRSRFLCIAVNCLNSYNHVPVVELENGLYGQ